MPAVGLTFSPINAPAGGTTASPLQDAIKLLSFKLPQVVGAGAGSGVLGPPTALGGLGPAQGNGGMNTFLMQLLQGLVPNPGAPEMGPGRARVQFPQPPIPRPEPPSEPPPPDVQTPIGFHG